MTREEKRLYLVGQLLSGGAHRSGNRESTATMGAKAIQIADAVLSAMDAMDQSEDASDRHDTIPVPARGPDDAGLWKPMPFEGEEVEEDHGHNGNAHAASR